MSGKPEVIDVRGGVRVVRLSGDKVFFFRAGMTIDADGSPRAYGPNNSGLDYTSYAGHPGDWWGVVTRNGRPVIQGPNDPYPGMYVSTTSLEDPAFARTDPRRYVNSEEIPFFVLSPATARISGAKLGDLGMILNLDTWARVGAIYADVGPVAQLGEASIAAARGIGVNSNARHGGIENHRIGYIVMPGSGNGHVLSAEAIWQMAEDAYQAWGGDSKAREMFT